MKEYPLQRIVREKQAALWQIKAAYLTEGQEIYFKRAMANIMSNE